MMRTLIQPLDEYNQTLIRNTHPPDWINPAPQGIYDMVVLGAGTAGLVTAAATAGLGGRVALIERHLMGGDCLNYGCVPSKALLHAGKQAVLRRRFGAVSAPGEEFGAAMTELRRKRALISAHDSASRLAGMGVDVYLGEGRFIAPREIVVAGKRLRFRKACIATGAHASVPDIPGLDRTPYLTNETLYNLTELPERLSIIGGGPVGMEMAQAFQRLGAQVTLLHRSERVLHREEPEAAALVAKHLREEGVSIRTGARILEVSGDEGSQMIRVRIDGRETVIPSDRLLVATGRTPNVGKLNLEAAGVRYDSGGVEIDDFQRTANPRIYACGDVASSRKFTHLADFQARNVVRNAFFFGRRKSSSLVVPWVTYTDPEIARVGLGRREAAAQGKPIHAFRLDFAEVDRSILESEGEGFAEVLVKKGTDRILGATIVHSRAGDMIPEIVMAMTRGIGLGAIAEVIHAYPTQAEIIRKLGDLYFQSRLTPRVSTWLRFLIKLGR